MKSFREFQESVVLSEQSRVLSPEVIKNMNPDAKKFIRKDGTFDNQGYMQSLPKGVQQDARIGGKTASPMGDAALLGLTAATVKAAPVLGRALASPFGRFVANNALRAGALGASKDAFDRGDPVSGTLNAISAINPIGGGIRRGPQWLKNVTTWPGAGRTRALSQSAAGIDLVTNPPNWAKGIVDTASSQVGRLRDAITGNNKTTPPKLSSPSATQQQVNKDNQRYGNTVPAGSFGISPKGTDRRKEVESQIKRDNAARAQNPTPTPPTPAPNPDKRADSDNFDSGGNKIEIGDPVGGSDMQPPSSQQQTTTPTPTPQPRTTPTPTETKRKPSVPRNSDGRIKLTPYKDRQYNPFQ